MDGNELVGLHNFEKMLGERNYKILRDLHGIPPSIAKEPEPQDFQAPGYEKLRDVLLRAFNDAARGKGEVRHADEGVAFEEQNMQQLIKLYGLGFATGQAAKKSREALRLSNDAAVRELLGAINYLAGAIIHIESK